MFCPYRTKGFYWGAFSWGGACRASLPQADVFRAFSPLEPEPPDVGWDEVNGELWVRILWSKFSGTGGIGFS